MILSRHKLHQLGLIASIKDNVIRHGYAFVPEYRPDEPIVSIAHALGRPLALWQNRLVQELIPRPIAPPNTYSGIFGLQRFPLHTDLAHWRLPPPYLLLRCVKGYAEVPTQIVDGRTLIEAISQDILTRAIVKPRRPQNGSLILLRLCEFVDERYCFRWDEVFLRPASRVGDVASKAIRALLNSSEPSSIPLVQAGDMLLVDNWRILHGRSPIPAGREDRKIERIYLERLH
ncbi:TauD/TfdA family dioxygenase [Bradyrhizobium yuanmingense]|uniref:TauD/TfdA family dioxygenase n=1 Tax=Bradyrhizobium yuanmingense TaxID=108015 RepID=UPI0023BA1E41|nr:TauD/TfdA family dioxygenase [Bradyrhizobium yuanmingense]MDF0515836.1 TauD/TfdA family dioxygenase [Bradyrhizobium yuanmingense]